MRLIPLLRFTLCVTLATSLLGPSAASAQSSQEKAEETAERALLHQSPEWLTVEAHLPDPKTATPEALETAADILRARRFLYDAMDFYRYSLDRGGDVAQLMNRLGMVEVELRHPLLARAYFLRAASLQPRNAQVWNNIGAAEFLAGWYTPALRDYSRAVKLEKRNAVYHSNLGTAYFETGDYESARRQFQAAYKLDPNLYQRRDGYGVEAHIFSSTNHGRFCFELARLAAQSHDDAGVISWLTKASDSGMDIQAEIFQDNAFEAYRKDPRIKTIVQNARSLRATHTLANAPVAPLPDKLTPLTP